MEQGPVLEELGLPLAPVAAISGQTRLAVTMSGSQARSRSDVTRASCVLPAGAFVRLPSWTMSPS